MNYLTAMIINAFYYCCFFVINVNFEGFTDALWGQWHSPMVYHQRLLSKYSLTASECCLDTGTGSSI
jgi:hypothetical protein